MSSHKTFRIKRFLAKKQEQSRPIPQQIRVKTANKPGYPSESRSWRRAKVGLSGPHTGAANSAATPPGPSSERATAAQQLTGGGCLAPVDNLNL
ncbi:large ribosomal subunit protein eL39-like [Capricornis sumatraensis]|uniref:large ribosomal subunit protein eL39-like n=1 Tax=Capricornis sumatraensis TaxID=34865 RepID=UPI00360547B5